VNRGLGADRALAALTTNPAGLLGVSATHGTLEKGRAANVIVASGDLFKSDEAAIEFVWVDGEPYEQESWHRLDARGTWALTWNGHAGPAEFVITGAKAAKLKIKAGDKTIAAAMPDKGTVLFFAPAELFGAASGTARLTATAVGDDLAGTGELPDGTPLRWTAKRTAPFKPEPTKPPTEEKFLASTDTYPAGSFGRKSLPAQPDYVLVRNGTVWTGGPAGIIEGGDVLIARGKVEKVGKSLTAPAGAVVVDATGQYVTAGLIDCHSHTAISRGVNEGASSVTVEVRIGDVLDPTDIGIYRELAGGLTVANVLHGSANAMGGQNQVIKLRWGMGAEELKFAGAKPGVKFALGENVVRANFPGTRTRYPMSRMGVPEIMLDTFNRAREYGRAWEDYRAHPGLLPPRRDLRLEAALEILKGDRLIHIHSYRQDEVLAFIRLAEQLHLNVATFQHILEGYKVAPEILKLGAGGSTFSDWWGYKFEVIDAIPYNGALMNAAGIVVSYNSDSDELARHLNTEAAKAVKYGGVAPAEAWKFVTLNPAKQLHIDDRVGSIEPGKDADFVIWNGNPLSTLTHANQTWIDGRRYFDREEDKQLRQAAATERAALLQKALTERQKALAGPPGGGGDGPPAATGYVMATSDDHDEYRAIYHNGGNAHTCSLEDGGHQ
jgi:imidazolonepropionase-like amidohydrolase